MAAFRVFEPAPHSARQHPLTKISSSSSSSSSPPRPSSIVPAASPSMGTNRAGCLARARLFGCRSPANQSLSVHSEMAQGIIRVPGTLFSSPLALLLCRTSLSLSLCTFFPSSNHPTKCRTSALPARIIICIWSVLRHHNVFDPLESTIFTHVTSWTSIHRVSKE